MIGRDTELADVRRRLCDPSACLLTLTGPVGVGKSRLAWAAVAEVTRSTGMRSQTIDLGKIGGTAGKISLLNSLIKSVKALGRRDCAAEPCSLLGFLRESSPCIIHIDHFEEVIEDARHFIWAVLEEHPSARFIASGIMPLSIYGEQVIRLDTLPVPAPALARDLTALHDAAAVQLLIQCARAAGCDISLTQENAAAVCDLCVRLDGLPLAIEFAATYAKMASPEAIVRRLDRGMVLLRRTEMHPFSLHRSTSAAAGWVFTRLTEEERALATRLSVFRGAFTLSAAEAVAGLPGPAFHSHMERLVDKSVLISRPTGAGEPAFRLLNVLRVHASRQLASSPESASARAGHAAYFLRLASGEVASADQAQAAGSRPRPQAQDALADLRAAGEYYLQQKDSTAVAQLIILASSCCQTREDSQSCLDTLGDALSLGGQPPALRARALLAAGELSLRLGQDGAAGLLRTAADLYHTESDPVGHATSLHRLGEAAYLHGDLADAEGFLKEGLLALEGSTAGNGLRAGLRRDLALVLLDSGDLPGAVQMARASLRADIARKDLAGIAHSRYLLATVLWLREDTEKVRRLFIDAVRQLGQADGEQARPCYLEAMAITLWKWTGRAELRRIVRLIALAHTLRARTGQVPPAHRKTAIDGAIQAACEELTSTEFSQLWVQGTQLSWQAAVADLPPPKAPEPQPAGAWASISSILTKREFEVASLIAQGMTNRSIASRLGIAEWTVVNHVRKVMRKLDCPSRVHVTRLLADSAASPSPPGPLLPGPLLPGPLPPGPLPLGLAPPGCAPAKGTAGHGFQHA